MEGEQCFKYSSFLLTINITGLKINCTFLYSILRRTITIFLVHKDLSSAETDSSLLDYYEGWLGNGHLRLVKKAEMNFCEDDGLFYSSSKKKYQLNWHLAKKANILSF